MPNPIPFTMLSPDQDIFLTGEVSWSHIVTLIEGEELERRATMTTFPITVPHTSITLHNAKILPAGPKPTIEEQYEEGRFYIARDTEANPGNSVTINNKGRILPAIFRKGDPAKGENPKEGYQIYPRYELARGSRVLLHLRTFKGAMGNCGIGLRAVMILDDKPKYFVPGNPGQAVIADAFASRGLNVHFTTPDDPELSGEEADDVAARTIRVDAPPTAPAPAMPDVPMTVPQIPTIDEAEEFPTGITLDSML